VEGIISSSLIYKNLSLIVANTLDTIAPILTDLQGQIDSLVTMILQNKRTLDMPLPPKGEPVLLLGKTAFRSTNRDRFKPTFIN
jgi:hypothetical protein